MLCQYLFGYLRKKNYRHYPNLFLFIIFPLSKFVLHSFVYFQIIWLCQLNYTLLNNQNILAYTRQLLWYSMLVRQGGVIRGLAAISWLKQWKGCDCAISKMRPQGSCIWHLEICCGSNAYFCLHKPSIGQRSYRIF